jgi:hypothetical protein
VIRHQAFDRIPEFFKINLLILFNPEILLPFLIASISLPGRNHSLRMLLPIARKRTSNIVNFLKLSLLIPSDEPFIRTCINQLTITSC